MDHAIELLKTAHSLMKQRLAEYEESMTKIRQGHALMQEGYKMLSKYLGDSSVQIDGKEIEELSEREREIFTLIGQGVKGADIAKKLDISIKTFNSSRDRIRKKLGIENAYELMRLAKSGAKRDATK